MKRRIIGLGALLAFAGVLLPVSASADGTVGVELAEFSITVGASTVEAGAVTFNVDNVGSFGHELVVIRTDLAADALPTGPGEGQADESQLDLVGEVRPAFDGGTSQTVTLDLEAGNYVLICNIFSDAFPPGHYGRGMTTSLTVTPVPEAIAEPAPPVEAVTPPAAGNAGLLGSDTGSTLLLISLLLAGTVALVGGSRFLARSRQS